MVESRVLDPVLAGSAPRLGRGLTTVIFSVYSTIKIEIVGEYIMRITYKGDYALKTILDLAIHYGDAPVTIHILSSRADIPLKFLEQILLDLKRGGFVESRRGKIGGYLLAKTPSQIKLGDVIRFIDGQIEPIACVGKEYKRCNDLSKCVFRDIWQQVTEATGEIVDKISFDDLVKKSKELDSVFVYQI